MSGFVKELIKGLFAETPVFGTSPEDAMSKQSSVTARKRTYRDMALEAYTALCEAIRMKGYTVIERSRKYLEREYGAGTRGYETGNTIEVEPGNLKALIHEYAAKLLQRRTGKTHDELHPQIYALAEKMERDMAPALG